MGVRCAAFSCRSGYGPTKKEKIMMKGKTPICKKHVFSFPKKEEIKIQWIAAVPHTDSAPNLVYSGVCELHFKPQDFALDACVGTKKERKHPRLKADAIPSVFDSYPDPTKPKVVKVRKTSQKTSQAHSAHRAHEQQVIQYHTDSESSEQDKFADLPSDFSFEEQSEATPEGETVDLINNMWDELSKERLPSEYTMVKMSLPENGQDVITIRMEEMDDVLGLPVIRRNLTIYPDLHYRMHVGGTEVSVHKASTLTAEFGTLGSATEVLDVLARLKTITADRRDLMACAVEMLERASEEGGVGSFFECRFAAELLKLKTGSADPGAALKNRQHRTQTPSKVDQKKAEELWDDVEKKLPLEFVDVTFREETAGLFDDDLNEGVGEKDWMEEVYVKEEPLEGEPGRCSAEAHAIEQSPRGVSDALPVTSNATPSTPCRDEPPRDMDQSVAKWTSEASDPTGLLSPSTALPGRNALKCEACPYTTSTRALLNRHARTHSGVCSFKAASDKSSLNRHLITQTVEKNLKSDHCPYRTSQEPILTRINAGEKPFRCSECSYTASRKSLLIQHAKTHTGEKPFKCSECSYSSSSKGNFSRHSKTHLSKTLLGSSRDRKGVSSPRRSKKQLSKNSESESRYTEENKKYESKIQNKENGEEHVYSRRNKKKM